MPRLSAFTSACRTHPLAKHLIWIVIIKMVALYGLWYAFIRPHKVTVTPAQIEQIYSHSNPATSTSDTSNASISHEKTK